MTHFECRSVSISLLSLTIKCFEFVKKKTFKLKEDWVINNLKMIPLWYQGLSTYFHEKFEKQQNIDVLFYCHDGIIGGHQIFVCLASRWTMFKNNYVRHW